MCKPLLLLCLALLPLGSASAADSPPRYSGSLLLTAPAPPQTRGDSRFTLLSSVLREAQPGPSARFSLVARLGSADSAKSLTVTCNSVVDPILADGFETPAVSIH